MWEHWNGIKEDGTFWSSDMNSFNHYAYGAVGDWLYGVAAGIRQQAAGKDIARTVGSDVAVTYVVGPFSDKSKADDLVLFIKAMGVNDAKCNVIGK